MAGNEDGFDEPTMSGHVDRYKQACRDAATLDGLFDVEEYEQRLLFDLYTVQGAFITVAVTYLHELLPDRSALDHWAFLVDWTRKTLEDTDKKSGPAT